MHLIPCCPLGFGKGLMGAREEKTYDIIIGDILKSLGYVLLLSHKRLHKVVEADFEFLLAGGGHLPHTRGRLPPSLPVENHAGGCLGVARRQGRNGDERRRNAREEGCELHFFRGFVGVLVCVGVGVNSVALCEMLCEVELQVSRLEKWLYRKKCVLTSSWLWRVTRGGGMGKDEALGPI